MDTSWLETCMNCAAAARDGLPQILDLVDSADESTSESCVAALENCGPPHPKDLPLLLASLTSPTGDRSYWSATLIGRLIAEPPASHSVDWSILEDQLVSCSADPKIATATLERIVWAVGQFPTLKATTMNSLASLRARANPRLQRLIDDAIGQGSVAKTA
jgi:hypothetical protein